MDSQQSATESKQPPAEHGLKWWWRYVLVPVIGTIGLVIVAWLGRSPAPKLPPESSARETSANQPVVPKGSTGGGETSIPAVPPAAPRESEPATDPGSVRNHTVASKAHTTSRQPDDGITVSQEVNQLKGHVTGVKANDADASTPTESISVTQKLGTVEGSVVGVDLSEKKSRGK